MSTSRRRDKDPDDLVIPQHRYKHDAKTRAAISLAAKIPLVSRQPKRGTKRARRRKVSGRKKTKS
jgi:hypothetical protein